MAETENARSNVPASRIEFIIVDFPHPDGADRTMILPFDIRVLVYECIDFRMCEFTKNRWLCKKSALKILFESSPYLMLCEKALSL